MEKLFIPFKLAFELKEKGFREPCLAKWMLDIKGDTIPHFRYNYINESLWFNHNDKDTTGLNGNDGKEFLWSAPTHQQAVDFIREKFGINIVVDSLIGTENYQSFGRAVTEEGFKKIGTPKTFEHSGDYYKSLNKAIEEILKLI